MRYLPEKVNSQHQTLKENIAIKQKQIHHSSLLCLPRRTIPILRDGMGSRRRYLYSHRLKLTKTQRLQKSRIKRCQICPRMSDPWHVVPPFKRLYV